MSKTTYSVKTAVTNRGKSTTPVPVTISKGDETHSFEKIIDASKFIANREFYAASSVSHHFHRRDEEVFGWHVTYNPQEAST